MDDDRALQITHNERTILDIVRRHEPIARSSIAGLLPISQPSVHRILDGLHARELVEFGPAQATGPGKPSPAVRLHRRRHYSLGISVNTDAIRVCLANLACEPVHETVLRGQSGERRRALAAMRDTAVGFLSSEGRGLDDLVGIGLGIAGYATGDNAMNPPEPLQDWSLIDLGRELSAVFDCPNWVENNATTAAIGESLIGVGRWSSTFAYLSFNYGFGGGAIIDGQPLRGHHGNAMEISAVFGVEEQQHRPALRYLLEELGANGIEIDSLETLRSTFRDDWPGVDAWVARVQPQLNRAIWAVRGVLDPEVIVFGGELPRALAERLIAGAVVDDVAEHRYGTPAPAPRLAYTEAAEIGPALGAALLPLKACVFL